ncbi:MAG: hypothetical protein V4702_02920 [Patescibacteria group bacterium]
MTELARPIVWVDMDGVLADFGQGVELELPPHIPIVRPRKNLYLDLDYPEYSAVVLGIIRAPGFYRKLPPIESALEGWQRLIDLEYDPRVLSSPLQANPACSTEKRDWLKSHFVPHFGRKVVDQALFVKDKSSQRGIALIDDHPAIPGAEAADWQHLVFDQPYNAQVETEFRLHGWNDPQLPELLERARNIQRLGYMALHRT